MNVFNVNFKKVRFLSLFMAASAAVFLVSSSYQEERESREDFTYLICTHKLSSTTSNIMTVTKDKQ